MEDLTSFSLIDTWHKEGEGLDNVHNLTGEELQKREVVNIDITDPVSTNDYKEDEDPVQVQIQENRSGSSR